MKIIYKKITTNCDVVTMGERDHIHNMEASISTCSLGGDPKDMRIK